jgi:Nucleotidyltransferase of unknown function (DUF6036)
VSDRLLDRETIRFYLAEVATELDTSASRHTVVVVGGALLAWHGLRAATRDVDSVVRVDRELAAAVERVARRHDLAAKWLNDSARAFLPATFELDECDVLIDLPSLLVLGAPWNQMFIMKLNASRAVDTDDLVDIWPRCSFASFEEAIEAFYAAYPLEHRDEFLAEHVRRIVGG